MALIALTRFRSRSSSARSARLWGGGDHAVTDIIAAARKRIETRRFGLAIQKGEGEDARKKIGAALKRLTHKGKGANVLAGLLQADLDTINRAVAQIEEEITACNSALAMAEDYAWDHDSARAQAPRHGEWPPVLPGMGFVEIDIEDFVRPAQYKQKGRFDD
jgi:hypothetical protein